MNNERKTVLTNMAWRFAERCGAEGVSFIVSLILARKLMPEHYGVVSIITVITAFLQIFVDSSFSSALIQKKNADQLDFSTVFFFNISMSVLLYSGVFIAAPAISNFYDMGEITPYIRVLSLTLVLGGINATQRTIVSKRMEFKRFFFATLIGTVISAFVGVAMAYKGFGPWALIAQILTNQTFDTFFLWITLKWRPSLQFSFRRLGGMMKFGGRLLISTIMSTFTNKLTGLLVGKYYNAEALAYYDKGQHLPYQVVQVIQPSVQSVLYPVMANVQDDKEKLRNLLHQSIMAGAYCIFPFMIGLAACADTTIRVLYTEKWIFAVPYLRIWCCIFALSLLNVPNLQAIHALGRSDIFLRIEIIKQALGLIGLLITVRIGIMPMMYMILATSVISYFINSFPNGKLVGYGSLMQMWDMLPIILLNIVMGAAAFAVGLLPIQSDILKLICQIAAGIIVYLNGSWILKIETFEVIKGIAVKALSKRQTGAKV